MNNELLNNFIEALQRAGKPKTSAYDTTATVRRIEDGIAWVHIPGGVDETPVKLTINAEAGDIVQVRVSGGTAFLVGNATAPPTDDRTAKGAIQQISEARKVIQQAAETVERKIVNITESVSNAYQAIEVINQNAVTNVVVQYAKGDSNQTAPETGWSTATPTWESGKYIWQRTVTTIDGEDFVSNTACIQGAKGDTGAQGVQGPIGPQGAQGVQGATGTGIASTTISYGTSSSASTQPTNWSTTVPTTIAGGTWLWTRTFVEYTDGTDSTSYSKAYVGTNGQNGQDGTSVTILGSYDSYAQLIAAHPSGNLGDSYMVAGDLYVWNGSVWQNVGTIQGPQGPQGVAGADGTSVTITSIQYGISASADTQPSSWSTTVPSSINKGSWLWVKTNYNTGGNATTKSYVGTDGEDGTSVYVRSATKTGDVTTVIIADSDGNETTLTIADGADGTNGTNGLNGYVHIAWANSSDGSVDFSTSASANKQYLGTYTDNTAADSQRYQDYSWSLIKGATGPQGPQGATGATGPQGPAGADGDDGIGVANLTPQYYLSTSYETPTGGSWQTTPPAYIDGRYYWTRTMVTWTDGTTSPTTAVYDTAITDANSQAYQALRRAGNAEDIAEATSQYFWQDTDGVHVASEAETPAATRNMLMNSLGMLFRRGANNILAILTGTSPGMVVYDGTGNADSNVIARYSADGVTVGKEESNHAEFTSSGFTIFDGARKQLSLIENRMTSFDRYGSILFDVRPSIMGSGRAVTPDSTELTFYSTAMNESISCIYGDEVALAFTGASFGICNLESFEWTNDGETWTEEIIVDTTKKRWEHTDAPLFSFTKGSAETKTRTFSNGSGVSMTVQAVYDGDHAVVYTPTSMQGATGIRVYMRNVIVTTNIQRPTVSVGSATTMPYSMAIGEGLFARSNELVVGKYNVDFQEDTYAFQVGGGASVEEPQDLFRVSWDGETEMGLPNDTDTSNVDYKLLNALTSLQWRLAVVVDDDEVE